MYAVVFNSVILIVSYFACNRCQSRQFTSLKTGGKCQLVVDHHTWLIQAKGIGDIHKHLKC
jgi:hypothetical protein